MVEATVVKTGPCDNKDTVFHNNLGCSSYL